MAQTYEGVKNRASTSGFTKLPYVVQDSPNFGKLTGSAIKLLLELIRQHRPHNNGRLIAAWSYLRERGWGAPLTIHRALKELEYYGFIIKTRQGGKNKFSFFALSWMQICWADDVTISNQYVTTGHVPNLYKVEREPYKRPRAQPRKVKRAKLVAIDGDLKD